MLARLIWPSHPAHLETEGPVGKHLGPSALALDLDLDDLDPGRSGTRICLALAELGPELALSEQVPLRKSWVVTGLGVGELGDWGAMLHGVSCCEVDTIDRCIGRDHRDLSVLVSFWYTSEEG
ncbi:hypothetical protein J7T55_007297 [Diaporthe amygdali]|uniref:uncharacterized protein n=1 Tax=Phomopsis amygdali TaxID=1214568 RepID=UPI0022FDF9C4|nr:uncharacterized protein J7T55_007297 [Diaporthe amygdali]KAJ0116319.1 hypothetical protein J7T55_007297 [Diaporthe amygdali]